MLSKARTVILNIQTQLKAQFSPDCNLNMNDMFFKCLLHLIPLSLSLACVVYSLVESCFIPPFPLTYLDNKKKILKNSWQMVYISYYFSKYNMLKWIK